MKNKVVILIMLAVTSLLSCDKNDENFITLQLGYVININNGKLMSCSKYDRTSSVKLLEKTYEYDGDTITEIEKQGEMIYSKAVFIMGDAFAKECFDTVFYSATELYTYHHNFSHLEGRLIRDEYEYKVVKADSTAIYNWINEYSYSAEGDMVELTKSGSVYEGEFFCDDIFTYTDKSSKFDVHNFISSITGEISTHLRKSKVYDVGCPGGPSYTYPESNYSYEINNDGYVEYMSENYLGGYGSGEVVIKTTFEYNFN
jgi:hypothetical protein